MLRAVLLVLLAVAAAWVPACRADGATIVVGAALDLSGPDAARGQKALAGYRAAVDHLNERGGIEVAGVMRPLRLVSYDDRGSAARAAALVDVLLDRRGASLLLGDVRPALTLAVAAAAASRYVPVVDIDGIARGPGIYAVVPPLGDQFAPALAGTGLAWRMAGRQPGAVGAVALAGDDLTRASLQDALAAWSFVAAGDASPDFSVVALPAPDRAIAPLAPVVVVLGCARAASLHRQRPDAVIVCVDPWPRLVSGAAALPDWLAAAMLPGTGAPDRTTVSAAVAVLTLAEAIGMARTPYGQVVNDSLRKVRLDSFAGPVRMADGANAGATPQAFLLSGGNLVPFDPTDPLGITLP